MSEVDVKHTIVVNQSFIKMFELVTYVIKNSETLNGNCVYTNCILTKVS